MPLEPVSALELLCHVFVPQNIKNTMSPLLEARVLDIFSEAAWDVPVCSRSGAKKVMSLWKTLEDTVEDVDSARIFGWKTQIQLFKLKKIYIHLKDLRLPRNCAGGVHVFQGVFQRLPMKHGRFRYIATPPDTFFWLAQEAAFSASLEHNVSAK